MRQEVSCRNRGAISKETDAVHGKNILAPFLHSMHLGVPIQGELAASESLIKGTALDFDFLLANSPYIGTESNQINGSGP